MTNNKLKLQQVLLECQQLQNENRMLKALLDKHNIPYEGQSQNQMQRKERQQIIKDRIRLFSSLFVGRKDVYALRWESIKMEILDILQPVSTNGTLPYVRNHILNAVNV